MIRRARAFAEFWYDFVIGDDWRVAVAVVAALTATYGLSAAAIPSWWVVPAAVAVVLPASLWRLIDHGARKPPSGADGDEQPVPRGGWAQRWRA